MIRIVLVEDHVLVRAGLAALLAEADDLEVVGVAASGADGVELATKERPDVVLMDLSMPDMDGVEATQRIVASALDTRVVVLTSFSDRARILAALDAGAVGYLLKDTEPDELFRGIRAAARGESPLAPKAASELLRSRTEPAPNAGLSERELEVLALVADGRPNKIVARDLGISEKTVKAHLTNIFQRIGVTDRTQAALWAGEHGIRAPRSSSK